ncbi:MAG: LytR/AlgR family response regulator transcription factor [Bacillota bacterium]|jgi:two-component system LytT family response regulator|uniref:Stage 0 sporulation protein A homolog n=1 Tax=Thermanaerosceptrum fracticalcis TaxID=1712410 RepID=A0A7G6E6I7_THEFR|nr:LytTR family DNA-binding domain-containing protein [Thermanaerosceptrum fracticalcis]QNB47691.1 response regulator [Thermanaerosceptrum fracticalcis]
MTLKALIVDDEYPARQELRFLLSQFNNIEVVGEAASASEALTLIKALDYQVLFLDINLPGKNGIELGAAIQALPKPPFVVYITAYDKYALEAFDVNAIDYILKPIDKRKIKRVIERVLKTCQESGGSSAPPGSGDSLLESPKTAAENAGEVKVNLLTAEKQGKTVLVDVNEIYYAFTEQDYVFIKTFGEKLFTRFTLKELEARLGSGGKFFRTHRCYIVNLLKVKEILPLFNGTFNLVLEDKDHSTVPVSRNQARKLRKVLGF